MSDTEKVGGLTLLHGMSGYPPLVKWMPKAVSSETQICPGDAVIEDISGQIETGNAATPGQSLYAGVALNYGAANTETGHLVVVDPNAVYDCVSNGDDESLSTKHRGEYCNLELEVSKTRQSQHKLDYPSVSANLQRDMLLAGVSPVSLDGSPLRVVVKFSGHAYAAGYGRINRKVRRPGRPPLFANKGAFERTLRRAFGLVMKDTDFREERIAYEIDRLMRNGAGEFDQRQLRKGMDRYYPDLSGDSERWCKIVLMFSTLED